MTKIQIHASQDYSVTIGSGILNNIPDAIPYGAKVCIICDSNVWPIYGDILTGLLFEHGINNDHFVFSAGESSKNIEIYIRILNFLSQNQYTRSDCIIALGGGVVGDLAGFSAATYLRGIPYIQVPTTLLAMVDSSVGGKTGIDLPVGKNLAGAFYQPKAVICDTDLLYSLPINIFRDGCAEVIKYAILYDPTLFAHLEERGMDFDREWVIARCIDWKRQAVEQDEFDQSSRMLLNFGHTIGHAIEHCSHYTISHGQAVAIGMAIVSKASHCPDRNRMVGLLKRFGLPTSVEYSADSLTDAALSDKKRRGNVINLIIPKSIGQCIAVSTPTEHLQAFIEAGL